MFGFVWLSRALWFSNALAEPPWCRHTATGRRGRPRPCSSWHQLAVCINWIRGTFSYRLTIFPQFSHIFSQYSLDFHKKFDKMVLFASAMFASAALISETGARILLCAYMSHDGTGLASALEKHVLSIYAGICNDLSSKKEPSEAGNWRPRGR